MPSTGLWLGHDVLPLDQTEAATAIMAMAAVAGAYYNLDPALCTHPALAAFVQALNDEDPVWRHLLAAQCDRHSGRSGLVAYVVGNGFNYFLPEDVEWDVRGVHRVNAVMEMLDVPFLAADLWEAEKELLGQLRQAAQTNLVKRSTQVGAYLASGYANLHGQAWAGEHIRTFSDYVAGKLTPEDSMLTRVGQMGVAAMACSAAGDDAAVAVLSKHLADELAEASRQVAAQRKRRDSSDPATPAYSQAANELKAAERTQRILRVAVEAVPGIAAPAVTMPDLRGMNLADAKRVLEQLGQAHEARDVVAPGGNTRWIMRDSKWIVRTHSPAPDAPMTGSVLLDCRHADD